MIANRKIKLAESAQKENFMVYIRTDGTKAFIEIFAYVEMAHNIRRMINLNERKDGPDQEWIFARIKQAVNWVLGNLRADVDHIWSSSSVMFQGRNELNPKLGEIIYTTQSLIKESRILGFLLQLNDTNARKSRTSSQIDIIQDSLSIIKQILDEMEMSEASSPEPTYASVRATTCFHNMLSIKEKIESMHGSLTLLSVLTSQDSNSWSLNKTKIHQTHRNLLSLAVNSAKTLGQAEECFTKYSETLAELGGWLNGTRHEIPLLYIDTSQIQQKLDTTATNHLRAIANGFEQIPKKMADGNIDTDTLLTTCPQKEAGLKRSANEYLDIVKEAVLAPLKVDIARLGEFLSRAYIRLNSIQHQIYQLLNGTTTKSFNSPIQRLSILREPELEITKTGVMLMKKTTRSLPDVTDIIKYHSVTVPKTINRVVIKYQRKIEKALGEHLLELYSFKETVASQLETCLRKSRENANVAIDNDFIT